MERTYLDFYIDLIANILNFLTYIKFCNYHFKTTRTKFIYIRNFTIYIIILAIISSLHVPNLWLILVLGSLLFNHLTYKTSLKNNIFRLLHFCTVYYLPFLFIYTITTILDILLLLNNVFYQNLKAIAIGAFMYVLYAIIFSNKTSEHKEINNPYKKYLFFLLSLVLIILCIFIFVSVNLDANIETFQNIIIITFMVNIMMIVLIISIYEKIVGFLQESALEQLKIQKYEMNQNFYDELSEKAKQLSSLRHDFKNHLIIMRGRLEKKEYNELSNYLDSIVTYVDDASDVILTNNPTISSMLQAKKSVCKKLDIRFDYELEFYKIYKITDIDLIIILGNIIDNAIDAVSKMYDNNKFINLTIKQVNTYLLIKCLNPYYEKPIEKNGQLLTTKSDPSLHGIGLMNVMDSCKKYNGECKYAYGDNEFHIEILVPNY